MAALSIVTPEERYEFLLNELEVLANRQPLKGRRRPRKWKPFNFQKRRA